MAQPGWNTGGQVSRVGRSTVSAAEGTEHLFVGWAEGFPEWNPEGWSQWPGPRLPGCTEASEAELRSWWDWGSRVARTQHSLPELGSILLSLSPYW